MNVIELFAGVGGFRVGLERYDKHYFNTVFFNQWEPSKKKQFAYDCYNYRFGLDSVPENLRQYTNLDIREVPKDALPDFDLLVGGFPCQDYSVAHSLVSSKGIEGEKGILWWDIRSTLEVKKPNFVLLENVDRLLKSPAKQRGKDFAIILKCFYELGYNVQWCVLNAADYNEPQKRRRCFIFGYKNTTNYALSNKPFFKLFIKNYIGSSTGFDISSLPISEISESFSFNFEKTGSLIKGVINTTDFEPKVLKNKHPLNSIVEHTDDERYYNIKHAEFERLKGSKKIVRTTKDGYTYTFSEGSCPYPDNLDIPARTMLTSEATTNRSTHIINDNGRLRVLTPIECERIQTFRKNWTKYGIDQNGQRYLLTDRERYFLMGNALVTHLITRMAKTIKQINEEELK